VKLLFACVLFAAISWSQGPNSGAINGTVTDSSGAVIPLAKVTATSPALQGQLTSMTNDQGIYRFPTVPIGTYSLKFEVPGMASQVRESIQIGIGFTASVDVRMSPANQLQTVLVTAETALIDTQSSTVQAGFDRTQLENVPNGRDMWSIIGVTPGMIATTIDVGGSNVGNQSGYSAYGYGTGPNPQNRVQIDGVNTTEGSGSAGFYYDYGSFAEFKVNTAANDASMPVPGNQINAVIKIGSNQFHGGLYFDYENPSFQGTNISRGQVLQGAGVGTRITEYKDINGDIGGPIKHDKLWFFLSLRDQVTGHTVTGFPVENPGSIPFLSADRNITYKVSYQLNQNHRLSTYAQWGEVKKPQRQAASNYYADAVYTQLAASWAGNVEYTGTLSPRLFLDVRVGTFGYNFPMDPYPGADGKLAPLRMEMTSGDIEGSYPKGRSNRRRWQYEPTGSYFLDRFLHANHQLKFGWLSEKEFTGTENYGPVNEVQQIYNSPAGKPDFSVPYQARIYNSPSVANDYLWHHGAYLQDQIRISKRLTVNAGVRWDYYRNFEPDQPIRSDAQFNAFFYQGAKLPNGFSIAPSYSSLSIPGRDSILRYPALVVPRLGMAWDLTGNAKTVVRLNWGRFYSSPGNFIAANTNPVQQITYTFGWNNPNNLPFNVNQLGAFASNSGGATVTMQPHIRAPIYDDLDAVIERQLTDTLSVRAGFIYRSLRHNWQTVDIGRTANLFTLPVVKTDPGPDGVTGTADDRTFVLLDIPKVLLPSTQLQIQAPDGNSEYYRSFELTVNKHMSHRFMAVFSYYKTWGDYPQTTVLQTGISAGVATNYNMAINNEARISTWASHLTGMYAGPWGVQISPVLRMQSGASLGRYYGFTGLNIGSINVPVEPVGAYRSDDIYVFDTRVEKQVRFKDRYRVGVFFDAFNILNTNAANTQDANTGVRTTVVDGTKVSYQRFLAPTVILPPRVFRIGGRFTF
jgi:hypothetical protein